MRSRSDVSDFVYRSVRTVSPCYKTFTSNHKIWTTEYGTAECIRIHESHLNYTILTFTLLVNSGVLEDTLLGGISSPMEKWHPRIIIRFICTNK